MIRGPVGVFGSATLTSVLPWQPVAISVADSDSSWAMHIVTSRVDQGEDARGHPSGPRNGWLGRPMAARTRQKSALLNDQFGRRSSYSVRNQATLSKR